MKKLVLVLFMLCAVLSGSAYQTLEEISHDTEMMTAVEVSDLMQIS